MSPISPRPRGRGAAQSPRAPAKQEEPRMDVWSVERRSRGRAAPKESHGPPRGTPAASQAQTTVLGDVTTGSTTIAWRTSKRDVTNQGLSAPAASRRASVVGPPKPPRAGRTPRTRNVPRWRPGRPGPPTAKHGQPQDSPARRTTPPRGPATTGARRAPPERGSTRSPPRAPTRKTAPPAPPDGPQAGRRTDGRLDPTAHKPED